jgi:hypothetical protein
VTIPQKAALKDIRKMLPMINARLEKSRIETGGYEAGGQDRP